jgi:hypothetical protein
MKKSLVILVLGLFFISSDLSAGSVSVSDAQTVALNFYHIVSSSNATNATLTYSRADAGAVVAFYVFDISPQKGFVIVAGDDNVTPILAYSTENFFHPDFGHSAINHWMHKTAFNIQMALLNHATADARISGLWAIYRHSGSTSNQRSTAVSPLCATFWDQENTISSPPPYIYNQFCPNNNADHQRCVTGCVATAMAQVMKYWNYPAQGIGSQTYIDDTVHGFTNDYGTITSNFGSHTYRWSLMPNIFTGGETPAQDSSVSVLMYDCAVSVGMDFGDDNQGGSGANALLSYELLTQGDSLSSEQAFVKFFSYDPDTIRGVYEANFSAAAWTALIKHEIDLRRPVIYEGNDTVQGGHAWVCDGYDSRDFLHMNWGWSGASNGYFAINNLTTSGNFNPILEDDALIGIVPRNHVAGISDLASSLSFDIYPNPTSGVMALKLSDIAFPAMWSLRDLLGQAVLSGTVTNSLSHISLSNVTEGLYMLEVQVGDQSAVKKVVLSR